MSEDTNRLDAAPPQTIDLADERARRQALTVKTSARLMRRIREAQDSPLSFLELIATDDEGNPPLIEHFHREWEYDAFTYRCVLEEAARGLTKCRASGQKLTLASGARRPIEQFADKGPVRVLAFDEKRRSLCYTMAAVTNNGVAPVVDLKLDSGRNVRLTEEEPLWTPTGWRVASSLRVGDYVAGVRTDPGPEHPEPMPTGHAYLIGALIGDGSCTRQRFTCADPAAMERFRALAAAEGVLVEAVPNCKNGIDYDLKGPAVKAFLRRYGLFGKTSRHKRIPDDVFRGSIDDVVACLAGYWDADGSASHSPDRLVSFASTARPLLEQVQSLLLRIGCVGSIRTVSGVYKNEPHTSYLLFVSGRSAEIFFERVPCCSTKAQRGRLRMLDSAGRRYNSKCSDVPWAAVRETLRGIGDSFLKKHTKVRLASGPRAHSVNGAHVRALAEALIALSADPGWRTKNIRSKASELTSADLLHKGVQLLALLNPEIWWDRIVAAKRCGPEQTWALTSGTETFVCEDGVAHNTSTFIVFLLWALGKNTNLRTKILADNDLNASKRLGVIRDYIKKIELVRLVFPNLAIDEDKPNNQSLLHLKRTQISAEPSVEARGVLSSGTGSSTDLFFLDDIVSYRNCLGQPALREEVKQKLLNDWFPTMRGPRSRLWAVFTPWHVDDANSYLKTTTAGEWQYRCRAHGTDEQPTRSLFPRKYPDSYLAEQLRVNGALNYERAYRCRALSSDTKLILPEHLAAYDSSILTQTILAGATAIIAVDPAKGTAKSKDPDSTAVAVLLFYQSQIQVAPATLLDGNTSQDAPPSIAPFNVFIPEVFEFKAGTRLQAAIIRGLARLWGAQHIVVEAQGLSSLHEWILEVPPEEQPANALIWPIPATQAKELRVAAVTPLLDRPPGHPPIVYFHPRLTKADDPSTIYLQEALPRLLPLLPQLADSPPIEMRRTFYHQAVNFPVTAHDDTLDAVVHGLTWGTQNLVNYYQGAASRSAFEAISLSLAPRGGEREQRQRQDSVSARGRSGRSWLSGWGRE